MPLIRLFGFLLILAATLLLSGATPAQTTAFIRHMQEQVDHRTAYPLIETLSSAGFEGRMTGQPGLRLTAELIADHFTRIGLQPAGDPGSFFQSFTLATNKIHDASLTVDGRSFAFGPDFISRGDGGSGVVQGEAVFVGRAIHAPEQGYDEFAGIDLNGKIAVALRGGHPQVEGPWGLTGWKVRAVRDHGAVGLILLEVNAEGQFGGLIGSVYFSNGDIPWDPYFPAIQGNAAVAHALFGPSGYNLPELIRLSNEERLPVSCALGSQVQLMVDGTMDLAAPTENVIGLLEGSDPKLKDEVIVLGGHMDHVGVQGTDLLFCGQDDNASGTATVMALAEAFATAPQRPKRTLLFMLYTGEEMGLLGARHWIAHPTIPLQRVKAMLNFDMTGQGTSLLLHNGANTPQLDALTQAANRRLYQLDYDTTPSAASSDHAPFWESGIPAVMYLNGGPRTYPVHQLGTFQPDGCNWELWEQVTEIAGLVAWELGNASRITDRGPAHLAQVEPHAHDHGAGPHHACY